MLGGARRRPRTKLSFLNFSLEPKVGSFLPCFCGNLCLAWVLRALLPPDTGKELLDKNLLAPGVGRLTAAAAERIYVGVVPMRLKRLARGASFGILSLLAVKNFSGFLGLADC